MEDEGAPRGIAEALQGILGTLGKEKWDRLNRISKDTGIYTSFVPEQYGGGGMGALGHVVLDEEVHKSIVQLPTSPVPMMMIGSCTPEQERCRRFRATCTTPSVRPNPRPGRTPAG